MKQGKYPNVLEYLNKLCDKTPEDRFFTSWGTKFPMGRVTATEFSKEQYEGKSTVYPIEGKHHEKLLGYHPITPIDVDVFFTAAPKVDKGYDQTNPRHLGSLIKMLRTQMEVLKGLGSETFITGPIGTGVFHNKQELVALAYAYVLLYCKPPTLQNVVFCSGQPFYDRVCGYYEQLVGNTELKTPEDPAREFMPDGVIRPVPVPTFVK